MEAEEGEVFRVGELATGTGIGRFWQMMASEWNLV